MRGMINPAHKGGMPNHAEDPTGEGGGGAHPNEGDGLHHHEIHETEGGGYHSVHKHPDGREEHADHPTYHHAVRHMHEQFGHEGGERDESQHAEPDGDEGEDGGLSEAYSED